MAGKMAQNVVAAAAAAVPFKKSLRVSPDLLFFLFLFISPPFFVLVPLPSLSARVDRFFH
jgi:hypothetical protein